MSPADRTTLGLDASTQSLSAVLLNVDTGAVIWQRSLAYRDDPRLLGFGFEHDTLILPPREPGEAEQPPRLFLAALDALFDEMKTAGIDTGTIAAINTSGQQHGHVLLNDKAPAAFQALRLPGCVQDAQKAHTSLATALADVFAYGGAPIWKMANTVAEAELIRARVGGSAELIAHTGSDMPLRSSVLAHRKLALRYPAAYAATRHIVQISSLIPALLAGNCAIPLDFGNACGTGLMNYKRRTWDETLLNAAARDLPGGPRALAEKLPPIAHPLSVVGGIAAYFQEKYGFNPDCRIIAGSGDNPQSKVLASASLLSLGTSFVYMIPTPGGEVDPSGEANAMYDALGRPFNLACRTNGALTLDRMRKLHGLNARDYAAGEAALATTPPGSRLRFWHPDAESFPVIAANPNVVRLDSKPDDFTNDYPAIVDSALGLVFRHGCRIGGQCELREPISVCGGPSGSHEIMRRVAAIWNRPAIHIGQAGAALGAAIAAAVALVPEDRPEQRDEVADALRGTVYKESTTVTPDPEWVRRYHASGGFLARMESAFEKMRT